MTYGEAVMIAKRIRGGERRIDEITLNRAERLLEEAGDERVDEVRWLKARQDRNAEWRVGNL